MRTWSPRTCWCATAGWHAGACDFGALSVGDPTVDLIVAWDVLDAPSREAFRGAVGVDDETWLRSRGLGAEPRAR